MDQQGRERAASAAAVGAVHALIGLALLTGLAPRLAPAPDAPLRLIDIAQPPAPPEPVRPAPAQRAPEPEGAAAPPALEAEATPVAAPEPVVRIELPPQPVAAAPAPALGSDVKTGASEVDGPGTGAGGEGSGRGSGSAGAGSGGGGDGGVPAVRTRRIRGHFTNRDYPRSAERIGAQGTVVARLDIGADGRVDACRIRVSSGNGDLDGATCRLILRRFRFAPARDQAGRPVPDRVEWEQSWSLRPEDRPDVAEAQCRAEADRAPDRERRATFFACMARLGWSRG